MMTRITLVLLLLALAGCHSVGGVKKADSGTQQIQLLTIENSFHWSEAGTGDQIFWTHDGLSLNRIRFHLVKDRKHILAAKNTNKDDGLLYLKGMNLNQVIELYLDAYRSSGALNLELLDDYYGEISGQDMAVLEFQYDVETGLRYRLKALLIPLEDILQVVEFSAPEEHYYPEYAPHFTRMIDGATLTAN